MLACEKFLLDLQVEKKGNDEHPDLPDDAIIVKSDINIFDSIFKKLRRPSYQTQALPSEHRNRSPIS